LGEDRQDNGREPNDFEPIVESEMAKGSRPAGGAGSKNVRNVGVRYGEQKTHAMSPAGVSQIGSAMGGKMMGESHTSINSAERIIEHTAKTPVPFGNALALNSGTAPGQGRTIYPSGTQHGLRPAQPLPAGRDTLGEFGSDVPGRGRR
jgi:hypothetical protein